MTHGITNLIVQITRCHMDRYCQKAIYCLARS